MSDENGVMTEPAQAATSGFLGLTVNEKQMIREGAVIKGFARKPGKPFSDPLDDRNFVPAVEPAPRAVAQQAAQVAPLSVPFMSFGEFCRQSVVEVVMSVRVQAVLGSYGDAEGEKAGHTVFSLLKKSYDACLAAYREGIAHYGS